MEKYKDIEVEDLMKSELKVKEENKKRQNNIESENNKEKKMPIEKKKSKDKEQYNKKESKNSDNFHFEEIDKEDAFNQVLYISYNHDNNFISLGTYTGFKIFSLINKEIELVYQFGFEPSEPIKIAEMLYTSHLILLVGKNESQHLSPKKLTIFNLGERKIVHSLNPYSTEIKLIRLNKKRMIVYADKSIFIYNLLNMKLLHTIKFGEDIITADKSFYQGQICLSPNSEENNFLVYSISQSNGLLKIYDVLYLTYVNFIQAHTSPLYKMCINSKGNLIATCSKNSGNIKIFNLPMGEQLFKFQRGYSYNTITGMNFSIFGGNKLLVSSGSGNIHIFDLDKSNQNNENENIVNKEGYLNQINKIYVKVTNECKNYLSNKNITNTVNIKNLKGENLLFFKEGKGIESKSSMNIIAISLEGFFYSIKIDTENYAIDNIYKKYIDSIKLNK